MRTHPQKRARCAGTRWRAVVLASALARSTRSPVDVASGGAGGHARRHPGRRAAATRLRAAAGRATGLQHHQRHAEAHGHGQHPAGRPPSRPRPQGIGEQVAQHPRRRGLHDRRGTAWPRPAPPGLRSPAVMSTKARSADRGEGGRAGASGSVVRGLGRPNNRAAVPPMTPNADSPIGVIGRVSPWARLLCSNTRRSRRATPGTGVEAGDRPGLGEPDPRRRRRAPTRCPGEPPKCVLRPGARARRAPRPAGRSRGCLTRSPSSTRSVPRPAWRACDGLLAQLPVDDPAVPSTARWSGLTIPTCRDRARVEHRAGVGDPVLDASPGLGEAVVSGMVNPDHLAVEHGRVVDRRLGDKAVAVRALPGGGTELVELASGGGRVRDRRAGRGARRARAAASRRTSVPRRTSSGRSTPPAPSGSPRPGRSPASTRCPRRATARCARSSAPASPRD